MEYNIHEQVKKQLEYLKYLVDSEIKNEEDCKEWGIPYTPSRRKYENISLYNEYKKEIERNGDKNLLVIVELNGNGNSTLYGVYPFAKRYVCEDYLVHRFEHGGELLFREDEVKQIKM